MSYSALVGSLVRRTAWEVIASVRSARGSAHIDLFNRGHHAELLIVKGQVESCILDGGPDPDLLDGDLERFRGGAYCLSKEIRPGGYAAPAGWVLALFEQFGEAGELEAWFHENGYGFGLVQNPGELLEVADQLEPVALLVDCPRLAGMTCEHLRAELTFEADAGRKPLVLITQSSCANRIDCSHFRRKTVAECTKEPIDVYSPVELCQISPLNVEVVATVIERTLLRRHQAMTRMPTLSSLLPPDIADELAEDAPQEENERAVKSAHG